MVVKWCFPEGFTIYDNNCQPLNNKTVDSAYGNYQKGGN